MKPSSPAIATPADVVVSRTRSVILTLAAPALLFLLVVVGFSVAVAVSIGGDDAAIAVAVERRVPEILLVAQLAMLGLLVAVLRRGRLDLAAIGWHASGRDVALGAAVGTLLAGVYITVLEPLQVSLQNSIGDYVPAGSVVLSLGASLPAFFVANVALAPFVEESLYRGAGLLRLTPPWSARRALLVTSALFGLLHWSGGMWYMLLTGGIAGVTFGLLTLRRRSVVPAFAAHLTLNVLEFVYVAWVA